MWLAANGGEISTAHIILGIWSEVDSPGHKILSNLGFNDNKAKELESTISKHGVTDEWWLFKDDWARILLRVHIDNWCNYLYNR